ncbi:MAG TPA: DAK2 domain-containing protein [Ruminiclostridium sp.]|nr:DAK2 domain-containing protein [Ruminiclostridium sp.]
MDKSYIKKLLKCISNIMAENRNYLIELDSVVGDGDLGLTMGDGFAAASAAAETFEGDDIGKLLYTSGKAMSTAVPSTMGTLMASGLMNAGKVLKGKTDLSDAEVVQIFSAYMDGVINRGKAKVGDKTFLDGINPAIEALNASLKKGESLAKSAKNASAAAENGFKNTSSMLAVHGRAATRGEASRSLLDPGAAVAMLIMKAFENSIG